LKMRNREKVLAGSAREKILLHQVDSSKGGGEGAPQSGRTERKRRKKEVLKARKGPLSSTWEDNDKIGPYPQERRNRSALPTTKEREKEKVTNGDHSGKEG